MSYFLIGQSYLGDGPLFVLWTRDASGVHVLPVGSRDRRDMQAAGRRLMEAWEPGADVDTSPQTIRTAAQRKAEERSPRLVDLDHAAREAIGRSIASQLELPDHDEPRAPVSWLAPSDLLATPDHQAAGHPSVARAPSVRVDLASRSDPV